jgi:TonB family protein
MERLTHRPENDAVGKFKIWSIIYILYIFIWAIWDWVLALSSKELVSVLRRQSDPIATLVDASLIYFLSMVIACWLLWVVRYYIVHKRSSGAHFIWYAHGGILFLVEDKSLDYFIWLIALLFTYISLESIEDSQSIIKYNRDQQNYSLPTLDASVSQKQRKDFRLKSIIFGLIILIIAGGYFFNYLYNKKNSELDLLKRKIDAVESKTSHSTTDAPRNKSENANFTTDSFRSADTSYPDKNDPSNSNLQIGPANRVSSGKLDESIRSHEMDRENKSANSEPKVNGNNALSQAQNNTKSQVELTPESKDIGASKEVRKQTPKSYEDILISAIRPNIIYSDTGGENYEIEVLVNARLDGRITRIHVVNSSGNRTWDHAVVRALERTNRLPPDGDGNIPAEIVSKGLLMTFRPQDLKSR